MRRSQEVDDFIASQDHWQRELKALREIMVKTPLEETIKWGAPCYMYYGKNVIGMTAFKTHVALWFYQGVFLRDAQRKLVNAQEGQTKALRQWRFRSYREIAVDSPLIKLYIREAIDNEKAGKRMAPERKKDDVVLPDELAKAFQDDQKLEEAFYDLTPGQQRAYAEFISEAKRDSTKTRRIEKIRPLILGGKGLNERYKK